MKNSRFIHTLLVLFLFSIVSVSGSAQNTEMWAKYEQEAEKMLQEFKKENQYEPFYVYEVKKIEFVVKSYISHSNANASDMYACSSYEVKNYDKLLNKYYKRLMTRLSPEKKEELRATQRLWLKFYEKNTTICSKMEMIVNQDTGTLRFPVELEGKANSLKYRVMELGWMINYLKY